MLGVISRGFVLRNVTEWWVRSPVNRINNDNDGQVVEPPPLDEVKKANKRL